MKCLLLACPLLLLACDRSRVQPYPLKICLVGGDDLGEMGEAEVFVHEGREIKVCCGACVATFKKDPAPYLRILDEAVRKRQGNLK